jgi:hypothetical protein
LTAKRWPRRSFAALLLLLPVFPPAAAQDNPLVQRGVPAEAAADNAVAARERAHASARRIALQRAAEALGATPPALSDAQIEALVAALVIEEERTTPTRYIGRLTVQFAPGPLGAALGRSLPGGEAPGLDLPAATVAQVVAVARLGGLPDWLDIRRRLRASGGVTSLEILEISMDAARLRLGLARAPAEAAALLAGAGLAVESEGAVWQVGLAGRR